MNPKEWTNNDQAFAINEWKNLNYSEIKGSDMSRHFLILGETGSGKTKSAIVPLLKSIINYKGKYRPSLLVIDPKNELHSYLDSYDKIINFQPNVKTDKKTIHFFEGLDLENISADEIKSKLLGISPRVMNQKNDFFVLQAEYCLKSFIDIDVFLYNKNGITGITKFWEGFIDDSKRIKIGKRDAYEKMKQTSSDVSRLKLLSKEIDTYDLICERISHSRENYFDKFSVLLNNIESLKILLKYWQRKYEGVDSLESYGLLKSLVVLSDNNVTGQLGGIIGSVNNIFETICSRELVSNVNLNPFEPPRDHYVSILDIMEDGYCLIYSPNQNSYIGDIIGRCLKSKFFEFTFVRTNQERPFAYICDEFQRFITGDRISGEQSFLDRCRAYRGICILASQSLASLSHSLRTSYESDGSIAESSINIILNNTGNKLFFRNTDIDTLYKLEKLIPTPFKSDRPHVIEVRPPSTLGVGECYYLQSNGDWGRRKINIE